MTWIRTFLIVFALTTVEFGEAARVTAMGNVVHIQFGRQGNVSQTRSSTGRRRKNASLRNGLRNVFQESFMGCSSLLTSKKQRIEEISKLEKTIQTKVLGYTAPKIVDNKCAADCVLRRMNLMRADGSISTDRIPMFEGVPNSEANQLLKDKMTACIGRSYATSTDHCQRATDAVACFLLIESSVVMSMAVNSTRYVGSILETISKNMSFPKEIVNKTVDKMLSLLPKFPNQPSGGTMKTTKPPKGEWKPPQIFLQIAHLYEDLDGKKQIDRLNGYFQNVKLNTSVFTKTTTASTTAPKNTTATTTTTTVGEG